MRADLRSGRAELPPFQLIHQIPPEPVVLPLEIDQPLRREPLHSPVDGLSNLSPKSAAEIRGLLSNNLTVEPGRSVALWKKIKPVTTE